MLQYNHNPGGNDNHDPRADDYDDHTGQYDYDTVGGNDININIDAAGENDYYVLTDNDKRCFLDLLNVAKYNVEHAVVVEHNDTRYYIVEHYVIDDIRDDFDFTLNIDDARDVLDHTIRSADTSTPSNEVKPS